MQIKFKDFITLQRGFDLPFHQRQSGEFDIISSNGFAEKHSEFKVKGEGVITGRSGTIGKVFYTKDNFWPLNTTLWVKDFKGNSPKFVYYFLQQFKLEQYQTGTGVPTLNRNFLDEIEFDLPDLATQQHIVDLACRCFIRRLLKSQTLFRLAFYSLALVQVILL